MPRKPAQRPWIEAGVSRSTMVSAAGEGAPAGSAEGYAAALAHDLDRAIGANVAMAGILAELTVLSANGRARSPLAEGTQRPPYASARRSIPLFSIKV